jgi:hypothetical protein
VKVPRDLPSRSSFASQGFGARFGLSVELGSDFRIGALRLVPRDPLFDSDSRSSFASQGFGARFGLSVALGSDFRIGALRPVPRVPLFDSDSRASLLGLSAEGLLFFSLRKSLSRLLPKGRGMILI